MQEKQTNVKQWVWSPEDQFSVDGKTVEIFMNLVQSILQDPTSTKVIWAMEAEKSLNQVMNQGIQDGIIKEKANIIYNDQNHYKNMSGSEFLATFTIQLNTKKDLPKEENRFKYKLYPSEKIPVLDGKYWIPEAELAILNNFKEKRISFGYNDIEDGYEFWINKF